MFFSSFKSLQKGSHIFLELFLFPMFFWNNSNISKGYLYLFQIYGDSIRKQKKSPMKRKNTHFPRTWLRLSNARTHRPLGGLGVSRGAPNDQRHSALAATIEKYIFKVHREKRFTSVLQVNYKLYYNWQSMAWNSLRMLRFIQLLTLFLKFHGQWDIVRDI